ncbi:hypothetical protein Goklo_026657 [Gossypium klotzschianum]|uniref:E3 ubiquitin-protein ligase RMA n=2 Tax=Gossypium TaxID=3633 RepID=A0A7J8TVP4_9ROSI|nr:hypothetical protein [Gossypium klotzschianum]
MGEEAPESMNLDLNLDPTPEPGPGLVSVEGVNSNAFVDSRPVTRIMEAVRRRRCRQIFGSPPENVELNQSIGSSGDLNTLQVGECSLVTDESTIDVPKASENTIGFSEDEVSEKKVNVEKGVSSDGSFFDCNICLGLAREPVVTCCGHLFCWSCLYRWLNVHSKAKECPVCKGEVTVKSVIPIYGQGKITYESEEDSGLKIPPRPTAWRVDSWRQIIQRSAFNLPIGEMIRSIGSRFHLTRDPTPSQLANTAQETAERTHSVLNRIMASRRLHRAQNTVASLDDVDLMHRSSTSNDVMSSRIHSLFLERQSQLRRSARITSLSSALTSAERLVEAYFRRNLVGRNQEQPPPVNDRDSLSSDAAVINTESHLDAAVEIDSAISVSTSSSSRRNNVSRVLDVDGVNPRSVRRRLN